GRPGEHGGSPRTEQPGRGTAMTSDTTVDRSGTATIPSRAAPAGAAPTGPARTAGRPVLLLWRREMIRLRHNPLRLAMGLLTPMLLLVTLEVLLIGLLFTALGLLAAVTIRQIDTFQIVVNLSLLPLTFFSGAMFPPAGLPGWLNVVVKLNPLTYGIDAVRRTLP